MSDYKVETGMRMLQLRKELKKSQAEVANHLGLTVAAYQNYEAGRREAGYEVLAKLADFYHVSTDYLLGRETEEEKELDSFVSEFDMSLLEKKIVEEYLKLSPEVRGDMIAFLYKAVMEIKGISSPNSPDEQEVIDRYRQLNEEGKEKAADNIDDLVTTGKYKKSDTNELALKKEA